MNHELLQQAIDTIGYYASVCGEDDQETPAKQTIQALRAELVKPEPEPVAIYRFSHLLGEYGVNWLITSELPDGTLLYTKEQL